MIHFLVSKVKFDNEILGIRHNAQKTRRIFGRVKIVYMIDEKKFVLYTKLVIGIKCLFIPT